MMCLCGSSFSLLCLFGLLFAEAWFIILILNLFRPHDVHCTRFLPPSKQQHFSEKIKRAMNYLRIHDLFVDVPCALPPENAALMDGTKKNCMSNCVFAIIISFFVHSQFKCAHAHTHARWGKERIPRNCTLVRSKTCNLCIVALRLVRACALLFFFK